MTWQKILTSQPSASCQPQALQHSPASAHPVVLLQGLSHPQSKLCHMGRVRSTCIRLSPAGSLCCEQASVSNHQALKKQADSRTKQALQGSSAPLAKMQYTLTVDCSGIPHQLLSSFAHTLMTYARGCVLLYGHVHHACLLPLGIPIFVASCFKQRTGQHLLGHCCEA
jgi:hypothetical protein